MALSSLQLEAFYALAQTGHFTKAAEKINITQSALSQRILNLETELETALFIRDRAGLRLTEAAEELLRYCQMKDHLEAEVLSDLRNHASAELSGTVRIAGFSSVMRSVVLPSLSGLIAKHPGLQLEFSTREMDELLPMLKSGEVDFIVVDRKLERDELESVALGHEENILVEKKGYAGPDIFLDHDERDQATFAYLRLAKKAPGKIRRRYLDDVYGIMEGVRFGLGRAVLPSHLIRGEKGLERLQPKTVLRVPVVLHFFKQPYYSKLSIAVREELGRKCADYL